MAHKDLSEQARQLAGMDARDFQRWLCLNGESLALAREAWINAFDKAAEELSKDEKSSIEPKT